MSSFAENKFRFPMIEDLRLGARGRIPRVAFDYVDCGVGQEEECNKRNQAAFGGIELVCRYGLGLEKPISETELFGRRYSFPFCISPMGLPSLVWPGGEFALAKAAQAANIPFVLGMAAGQTVETMSKVAPDVLWFQIHRIPQDNLAINIDLAKRAQAAGVKVLVLTIDLPSRGKRRREFKNRLQVPFKITPQVMANVATHPQWLMAFLQRGFPRLASFTNYVTGPVNSTTVGQFAHSVIKGAYTWDEIALLREKWPHKLVLKGVLHPDDAEQAVKVGADGIIVSNHGGRQFESAPATIDVLPSVAERVAGRMTVLMDGGIRCGTDILKAQALGADAVLAGRPFMYGLGALGLDGPEYVIKLLSEEFQAAQMQVGVPTARDARAIVLSHAMGERWKTIFHGQSETFAKSA